MLRSLFGATALAIAVTTPMAPAFAQTAPTPAPTPDPARLALAQALVEQMLPAEKRDAMLDQMMRPMMENMRGAMMNAPKLEKLKAENPEFGPAFDAFIKNEFERSIALAKAVMPKMLDAMARAYARRFSLDELKAITAFFNTPAGQAYAQRASTVMSDPDVIAVMVSMMNEAQSGAQERVTKLLTRLGSEQKAPD